MGVQLITADTHGTKTLMYNTICKINNYSAIAGRLSLPCKTPGGNDKLCSNKRDYNNVVKDSVKIKHLIYLEIWKWFV